MTQTFIFIGIGIVILVVNAVILMRLSKQSGGKEAETSGMLLIQNQFNALSGNLNKLTESLNSKMVESSDRLNDSIKYQAGESNKIIRDITERLTRLDETNKQVVSFADQLQSLQDILKNPKQRGVLGEYYLETLLKNVLPPGSFETQYKIGKTDDGADLIVDAIVRVKDYIIPVDSKFSLENYNRIIEEKDVLEKARLEKVFVGDLKARILETSKYIRPQDGTTDFAFMFIPHEAIYYDLLVNKIGEVKGEDTENLIQRAANKYKVIIVSPTSFLAYLQTVLQGLKALKIEEEAKNIIKRVDELGKHVQSYEIYHAKLGNSLATTVSHFNASRKELGKIDKDVMRITGEARGVEPLQLDKPIVDSE